MDKKQLISNIKEKQSYLCVGLDTDINRIPTHLHREADPIFEFNKQIIDATIEYCVAYKPNLAFYEAEGSRGWESLQKTIEYLPKEVFTIADAKRGDIGITSSLYARAFFDKLNFDSITVAPYMGSDSVRPFLEYPGKWVILLAHTSNPGSHDFQLFEDRNGKNLYQEVLDNATKWGSPDQLMFVVGATRANKIAEIRAQVPDYFFLVPGVGAQGGDLREVSLRGFNKECGLLVNSSRGIIYASTDRDFAQVASLKAKEIQQEMSQLLDSAMG